MLTSDKPIVQLISDQCEAHGVRHIVLSPGSRNASFAIAFDENPFFKTYVIHDERSAAFFALGMATELNESVAICCTSGTAALNYYPAIAEAYYRSVPLLVITADRPKAWINQGDGQTIMQTNVFQNHIRFQTHIDDGKSEGVDWWNAQRETAIAFTHFLGKQKGPVHINVGLNEPLYRTIEKTQSFARKLNDNLTVSSLSADFREALKQLLPGSKIMVLCGQLPINFHLLKELETLSADTNCLILVENTSNLQSEHFVHCIDRTLNSISSGQETDFQPDVLISIGGAVVSKRIKAFLRKATLKAHIRVGYDFPFMDTYMQLSHDVQLKPEAFFAELNTLEYAKSSLNYAGKWRKIDYLSKDRISDYIASLTDLTDIVVFNELVECLPENSILHMANSSVVRYCQLFDPIRGVRYESNRGTSGIDGSFGTAVGAAVANPEKLHIHVTGDVSFLYDSNALWINPFPENLRVLLVNNSGGGIFRIIDGPATSKQRSHYFEAVHAQHGAPLATAFGKTNASTNDKADFQEKLSELLFGNSLFLLEVHTVAEKNADDLTDFFNYLRIK